MAAPPVMFPGIGKRAQLVAAGVSLAVAAAIGWSVPTGTAVECRWEGERVACDEAEAHLLRVSGGRRTWVSPGDTVEAYEYRSGNVGNTHAVQTTAGQHIVDCPPDRCGALARDLTALAAESSGVTVGHRGGDQTPGLLVAMVFVCAFGFSVAFVFDAPRSAAVNGHHLEITSHRLGGRWRTTRRIDLRGATEVVVERGGGKNRVQAYLKLETGETRMILVTPDRHRPLVSALAEAIRPGLGDVGST